VLKPGGHAVVITEYIVRLHPLDTASLEVARRMVSRGRRMPRARWDRRVALAEMFTRRELMRLIVRPSGLRLMQPLDFTISPESWDNLTSYSRDERLVSRSGQTYPMVLMQKARSVFTSVCLILEKPPSAR
jgi:hypothetical protein